MFSFYSVVNQLKSLLLKQGREIPSTLSPSKKQSPPKVDYAAQLNILTRQTHRNCCFAVFCLILDFHSQEGRSSLPAFHDLVPIVNNQSEYIKHLEAEVKFCKVCAHKHFIFLCFIFATLLTLCCVCVTSGRAGGNEAAGQSGGCGE